MEAHLLIKPSVMEVFRFTSHREALQIQHSSISSTRRQRRLKRFILVHHKLRVRIKDNQYIMSTKIITGLFLHSIFRFKPTGPSLDAEDEGGQVGLSHCASVKYF